MPPLPYSMLYPTRGPHPTPSCPPTPRGGHPLLQRGSPTSRDCAPYCRGGLAYPKRLCFLPQRRELPTTEEGLTLPPRDYAPYYRGGSSLPQETVPPTAEGGSPTP